MKIVKTISILGVLAMTAVLVYGFTVGDFFGEGSQLTAMPWGIVSLVDLYMGFILFSMWIIYREKYLSIAILWTIAMMTLGFFAGNLYAFIALQNSRDDWRKFWFVNLSIQHRGSVTYLPLFFQAYTQVTRSVMGESSQPIYSWLGLKVQKLTALTIQS